MDGGLPDYLPIANAESVRHRKARDLDTGCRAGPPRLGSGTEGGSHAVEIPQENGSATTGPGHPEPADHRGRATRRRQVDDHYEARAQATATVRSVIMTRPAGLGSLRRSDIDPQRAP